MTRDYSLGQGKAPDASWRALALFAIYHLVLGFALLLLQQRENAFGFAIVDPELFQNASWLLVAASPVALSLASLRWPSLGWQIHAMLLLDVAALTLLMHASGGVNSGIGLLLAVSLAVGSLLTRGISPFFFAALAASSVIAEQTYSHLTGAAPLREFLHAGLLGMAFFSIAFLDHALSRRLEASERLLQEQELDLDNLNAINSYVIDLLDLGVLAVDERDRITMLNGPARHWFGYRETVALPADLSLLNADLRRILSAWRLEAAGGPPAPSALATAADELALEFVAVGGTGHHGAVLILVRDMARVRADAHKSQLVAIGQMSASIAHEIRNPLSAIRQGVQLLREADGINPAHRHLADIVSRNTERLNRVVENILNLSRNREPLQQPVELCGFVEQLVTQFATNPVTADARIDVSCRAPATALMDPSHLEQVLVILCENAAKHGTAAGTAAGIDLVIDSDADGAPVLDVVDKGPGIAAAVGKKIFDPFVSTSGSTGLGLFLARQLCIANRARLTLENSKTPEGACFRITMLPGA